LAHRP